MNDGEVLSHDATRNARNRVGAVLRQCAHLLQVEVRGMHSRALRRQRGEEREWQIERMHQLAKLRPVGAIPGDDRIEAAQLIDKARQRLRYAQ